MDTSLFRDYPIKVNLNTDETVLLEQICKQHGFSSSEALREALEYAMSHTGELDTFIQSRKLKRGQKLFQYWDEPKETRNTRLLEELVGEGKKLRCKLLLTCEELTSKVFSDDCKEAVYNDNTLRLCFEVHRRGKKLKSEIMLYADSILSVSTYDERTNKKNNVIPMRFEALTENEYLQIELR